MGNQGMEAGGNGIAQSSSTIINFPGTALPETYRIMTRWRLNNHFWQSTIFKLVIYGPIFEQFSLKIS